MKKIDFELRVVLVNPLYERNIGAVSRAMSNMGFERLILIAPQCEIGYEAQQAAATGQDALRNRVIYSSWQKFDESEPDSVRIAFSTKDGKARQIRDLKPTLEWIRKKSPHFKDKSRKPVLHFVFGREDWGLSSEDLDNCNFPCCLPTYGDNPSMNLAQAALIALFILRESWGGSRTPLENKNPIREESEIGRKFPEKVLQDWLETLGFDLDRGKVNAYSVLKRILLQNAPNTKELRVLEAIVQQTVRKLKDQKSIKKK